MSMSGTQFEVVVDYSGMQPHVNVNSLLTDVELDAFPELLSYPIPIFTSPSLYYLYLLTPPNSPQEYVVRLPRTCSEVQFFDFEDVSFVTDGDVPTWYTYGDAAAPSVIVIPFFTTTRDADIVSGIQTYLASWADTLCSYLPASAVNVHRVLCTTTNILAVYADSNLPQWHVDLSATASSPCVLLDHTVHPMLDICSGTMPQLVCELLSDTHSFALLSRWPQIARVHSEVCVSRLPVTPDGSACVSGAVPVPPVSPHLSVGDWVIYLSPLGDSLRTSQVRHVDSHGVTLENDDAPTHIAKIDPVCHDLLTDLQPVASFLT
jgi:hypothetical protein